eukprot:CAMPEP_0202722680 /NCGR_PEP_ID=MMETSP1385-20130828/159508_1 /ASSEMBLY_ACC=CAM_ASM_000861 /TAXON_ID=933848 /ORGANISM="Elphidium margaritaceum" /LENGTH=103 /DNA_ID=CAMNT_0049387461 /DNA_START=35 /DNA_END=343 /DNA_ORIENTATION=+
MHRIQQLHVPVLRSEPLNVGLAQAAPRPQLLPLCKLSDVDGVADEWLQRSVHPHHVWNVEHGRNRQTSLPSRGVQVLQDIQTLGEGRCAGFPPLHDVLVVARD